MRWRKAANKGKKSKMEARLFQNNEYTLFREDERPGKPSVTDRRHTTRYDGPHDGNRNGKRRRSSKDRRHVTRKKTRRVREESESDYASESEISRGNYSSDSEPSRSNNKRERSGEDSPTKPLSDKKNKTQRRVANSPVGMLIPKINTSRG